MTGGTRKVPCATCGQAVDVSRAPRVRFASGTKWYFCSVVHADEFLVPGVERVLPSRPAAQPLEGIVALAKPGGTGGMLPPPAASSNVGPSLARAESAKQSEAAKHPQDPKPTAGPAEPAQLASAETAAAASPATTNQPTVSVPPVGLERPQPAEPGFTQEAGPSASRVALRAGRIGEPYLTVVQWIPCVVLALAAVVASVRDRPAGSILVALAILVVAQLVARHRWGREALIAVQGIPDDSMRGQARVVQESGTQLKDARSLRAGEEILVETGDWICVDGVVSSGQASVYPWAGAGHEVTLLPGSRVVAGARVISGHLNIVATKTGPRRAFYYPHSFFREYQPLWLVRLVSFGIGPGLGLLVALLLRMQEVAWTEAIAAAAAVFGAFALPGSVRLCEAIFAQAWSEAARRGISYCDAKMFDRAGQVNAVIFCARGTVLNGEPDVAEVHVFRDSSETQVLALAAGAESAVHHPVASATLRAAHHRGVSIDACRGHHVVTGLGVVCSSSDGRAMVVGSRELLLREKISVAIAEDTLRVLEMRGLSTLLVALGGRLIGILALQDSLRAGARATVQLLIDGKVEPILLSGDTRATTEAVAHALSFEHVRPEVPALLRAHEVRNLIDSGLTVAVVGTSPLDDVALGAGQVPIILQGAAMVRTDSPHGHERGTGLSTDRVIDAAVALLIARRARNLLHSCLRVWLLSAGLGALLVMSQLGPLFTGPLFGGAGLVVAHFQFRRSRSWVLPP